MSNTIQHLRADLMFCIQQTLRLPTNLGHVGKESGRRMGCNAKPTLHGTMPNTDAAVWLSLSVNTHSLKAKLNRLQTVRCTGTLLTLKPMDLCVYV